MSKCLGCTTSRLLEHLKKCLGVLRLEVLRRACTGNVVFVERLDQFKIHGQWLSIPICGYLVVEAGKIRVWKDYWCYQKYKAQSTRLFGPDFSLFKVTESARASSYHSMSTCMQTAHPPAVPFLIPG